MPEKLPRHIQADDEDESSLPFYSFCVILSVARYGLGAARTAGGWPRHPKGGEAHAYHITYRTVYRDDYCEKQKPPLCQVTVSFRNLIHLQG